VVAPELAVVETVETLDFVPHVVAPPASKAFGLVQAGVLLIVGIAGLYLSLVTIGHVAGIIKVPAVLVSVGVIYAGIKRATRTLFGPTFDTGLWMCGIWLVAIIGATTFADLLPLGISSDTTKTIGIPGNLRPDLFSKHPLGTNNFSLDLLSRCIYAARVSLLTATFAVAVSMLIGGTIGMLAGYFRGPLDQLIGVATDSFLAFPALILLIAIAAILGIPTSVPSAIIKEGSALAIVGIPTMVRLARANTMVYAQREFVLSSRAMGAKDSRIILREILPNVILPLLSFSFIIIAVLIVAEGSLAFLGLGLQQPLPTWGNMIAEGDVTTLRKYPFIPLVPGMFMFLTVFSFNRVGEFARSLWDPRSAKL
jgi:peptide/nickel transport system permease protein